MAKVIPVGKGIFIHRLENAHPGRDMGALAQNLKAAGFSWVAVKAADGFATFNDVFMGAFMGSAAQRGLQVWGWQYVYGARTDNGVDQSAREADVAKRQITAFNFAGWIVDAEKEYKRPNASTWARTYMGALRSAFPDLSLALCSYRYPTLHRELPWRAFLDFADLHMPQVYWAEATNPGAQLRRSVDELLALKSLPVVPVGAAYEEHGWRPSVSELNDFNQTAQAMGLPGITWWLWDNKGLMTFPEYLAAITAHQWGGQAGGDGDMPAALQQFGRWVMAVDAWARKNGFDGEQPFGDMR